LTVNNDPILWAMVNALKELAAQGDARNAELRKEIESLKARLAP